MKSPLFREIEYIALSRDVTESDLKQRREICKGTSIHVDQCCVRAALKGRILILDGIQYCERNGKLLFSTNSIKIRDVY
jgi:hypothetical protein